MHGVLGLLKRFLRLNMENANFDMGYALREKAAQLGFARLGGLCFRMQMEAQNRLRCLQDADHPCLCWR
jgi:hypothetical protein